MKSFKRREIESNDDWPWGLSISYINGGSGDEFKKLYGTRRSNSIADYKWSSAQIKIKTWQHAMIIVEDGMQSIYVDGLFDSSYQFTQPQLSNNKNLNIGWNLRPGEEQFKGEIDDIRIYNRALTAEEIKAVYLE